MSKVAEQHLVHEFDRVIDRFRQEYQMTYAQVLGCLDLLKADLIRDATEDDA